MDRLFIGLPIDSSIGAALAEVNATLSGYAPLLKIVPPDKYHITVQFLGDVDLGITHKLQEEFSALNDEKHFQKVPFQVIGLGAFPQPRKATVLWAGINAAQEKIIGLKEGIGALTLRYGFSKEDRDFKPHLTLARVKKNSRVPERLAVYIQENKATFFAEAVFFKAVLFKSNLTKEGPLYTELCSIDLK